MAEIYGKCGLIFQSHGAYGQVQGSGYVKDAIDLWQQLEQTKMAIEKRSLLNGKYTEKYLFRWSMFRPAMLLYHFPKRKYQSNITEDSPHPKTT